MQIEGTPIPDEMLRVELQPEVGTSGYDAGAEMLTDFFARVLRTYVDDTELEPLGRTIIETALGGGSVAAFESLTAGATQQAVG